MLHTGSRSIGRTLSTEGCSVCYRSHHILKGSSKTGLGTTIQFNFTVRIGKQRLDLSLSFESIAGGFKLGPLYRLFILYPAQAICESDIERCSYRFKQVESLKS